MEFDLRGTDGRSVYVTFDKEGESFVSLRNSMIAKSQAVTVERFSQSAASYLYRAVGGAESLLVAFRGAPGQFVIIGPPKQGGVVRLIKPEQSTYVIQSALLSFDSTLAHEFSNPGISSMLAGYGISQVVFSGEGTIGVVGNNFIDEVTLENEDIFVDSKHVVAWEKSLEFKVETIKFKGVLGGMASGDVLGAVYRGSGKLWIQSSVD